MVLRDIEVRNAYEKLKKLVGKFSPEAELILNAELVVEIEHLKKQRNAVVLGHNYMDPSLYHTIPDFKGDSLELSRKAAETDAEVIVFCGVEFMAETAKILSPNKTVLVPSNKAGCSLAESITGDDVGELKKRYPGSPVVSYVNTFADVKAETDICCTSSNAVKVVQSLNTDNIIFIPDEYLASNVARETGKNLIFANKQNGLLKDKIISNSLITWPGKCEVHDLFSVEDVQMVRKMYPDAQILAHPECKSAVCEASDFTGSTSAMINHVKNGNFKQYMLFTECSMGDNIVAEFPDKELVRMCSHRCPHMAQITLEMTRDALKFNQFEIKLDFELMKKARLSLERMLEIG